MTGALAWTGRLVFLVLAMLAALSIIGSIAAIPSSVAEQRLQVQRDEIGRPDAPVPEKMTPAPSPVRAPQTGADQPVGAPQQAIAVPMPPERDDPLLWLEPLTYALLALAGLVAIGVLLLWRAVLALESRPA